MSLLSNTATDIAVVVVTLGLMVFIHEFGHFVAAKWMGVRVVTFSLGFGKRLFGLKNGEFTVGSLRDSESKATDYRVSVLPLGGYVRMAGDDPCQPLSGDPDEFLAHPRWQRFTIVVMGPTMNVLLAIALLTGLNHYHYEVMAFETEQARVGKVEPGSAAAKAGIMTDDLLTRVGDLTNPKWEDVELKVAMSPGTPLPVDVIRNGEKLALEVTPRAEGRDRLGVAGWQPCMDPQIDEVQPGLPASRAGIKKGDLIVAIGGRPIFCSQDLISALQASAGKPVEFTVSRGGQDVQATLTPVLGRPNGYKQWIIGVGMKLVQVKQLAWPEAVASSVEENIKNCELTFDAVGKVLTHKMSARSLSGPIGIAQMSGEAYRAGLSDLIQVSAAISLELGIFNLLPVPILDGGVIFLLLIESVMRRDLSLNVKERVVQIGLALLLLLTVFVMYNDIVKSFKPS